MSSLLAFPKHTHCSAVAESGHHTLLAAAAEPVCCSPGPCPGCILLTWPGCSHGLEQHVACGCGASRLSVFYWSGTSCPLVLTLVTRLGYWCFSGQSTCQSISLEFVRLSTLSRKKHMFVEWPALGAPHHLKPIKLFIKSLDDIGIPYNVIHMIEVLEDDISCIRYTFRRTHDGTRFIKSSVSDFLKIRNGLIKSMERLDHRFEYYKGISSSYGTGSWYAIFYLF